MVSSRGQRVDVVAGLTRRSGITQYFRRHFASVFDTTPLMHRRTFHGG
jgi:hypothetical protein